MVQVLGTVLAGAGLAGALHSWWPVAAAGGLLIVVPELVEFVRGKGGR